MKAIEISQFGGPEVLRLVDRPTPQPGPGEVLIRVAASGINRPDIFQRMGKYAPPPGVSDLPGLEVAGTIVEGEGTGDDVCALLAGGGYAEYVVAPRGQCLPVPRGLSLIEAASLPETFFTVWSNVFDRGRLTGKESLLVQGGSSGIGVAAIQIAHALRHPVFATAGSAEKCRACERLGARAINYKNEDFVERIRAWTNGRGVDVILDMVAGDYIPRDLEALAEDGRLVVIATLGGASANVDVAKLMRKRQTITGSTLRPRPVEFKAAIARKLQEIVWPLIESGKIRPVVYETISAAEAARAHTLLESGAHIGKIILRW